MNDRNEGGEPGQPLGDNATSSMHDATCQDARALSFDESIAVELPFLFRKARAITLNDDMACEITQIVFERVLRHRREGRFAPRPEDLRKLLGAYLRFVIHEQRRERRRYVAVEDPEDIAGTANGVEFAEAYVEARRTLVAADELTTDERDAIVAAVKPSDRPDEVETAASEVVRQQRSRARGKLRGLTGRLRI